MKYAEIRYELVKKNFPQDKIRTEIKRIKKAAKEISKDSGVPVSEITQMMLENIDVEYIRRS